MKITLSMDEITTLVRAQYNAPDAEVCVTKKRIRNFPTGFPAFEAEFGTSMTTHNKIAAIKRLREIVPGLGLAGAKYAVENWNPISNYVSKHKRWPAIGGDGCFKLI